MLACPPCRASPTPPRRPPGPRRAETLQHSTCFEPAYSPERLLRVFLAILLPLSAARNTDVRFLVSSYSLDAIIPVHCRLDDVSHVSDRAQPPMNRVLTQSSCSDVGHRKTSLCSCTLALVMPSFSSILFSDSSRLTNSILDFAAVPLSRYDTNPTSSMWSRYLI